jgi:predicted DNA-binding WGR domain protein
LRYVDRAANSDKTYILRLIGESNGLFGVTADFGRTGKNLQSTIKAFACSYTNAQVTYDQVKEEKRNKGYRRVEEFEGRIQIFPTVDQAGVPIVKKKMRIKSKKQKVVMQKEVTILDDPGLRKLTI